MSIPSSTIFFLTGSGAQATRSGSGSHVSYGKGVGPFLLHYTAQCFVVKKLGTPTGLRPLGSLSSCICVCGESKRLGWGKISVNGLPKNAAQ